MDNEDTLGGVSATSENTACANAGGAKEGKLCANAGGTKEGKPSKDEKKPSSLAQMLSFAGSYKVLTYAGTMLSAVSMLLGFGPYVCIWFALRDLIEVAPDWSSATKLATYGWVGLAFAAGSICLYFLALMCTHLAAFRTASNMRKRTVAHLSKLPLGYFDTHASGELRRVIDGCASQTESLLAHMLPDMAGSLAMVVGMLVALFGFDWRLGVSCLVPCVVSIACIMSMMSGKGMEFMKQYQGALVRMTKTGTEYVRGIPVVKVFQQTVYSFRAFHDAIQDYARMAQSYAGTFCRFPQVLQLTVLNGLVVFLVPAAFLLAPGETDFAHFVMSFAFYAIFSAVVPTAMTKLMFLGEGAQMAGDALARIHEILNTPPLPVAASPKHTNACDVSFENVSFTYEGASTKALDRVSFSLSAGTTVALVGPSGGGKSTCASLIPRFWDADEGAVRIGGVDVRELDPHELMEQVAFVFQSNRLFSQSLADNVRAARPDASDDQVMAALEAAQCGDIVAKLPQGIHTMLGAGGAYLSGGEVQRVILARAILKNAPIVVLDEATAFADPENEVLIQRAFARLTKGRTVLMIAHRLSTVVRADKIIVLDQGKIVEEGAHAELLAAQGLYARMWAKYEKAISWKIGNAGADGASGIDECGVVKGVEA